MGNPLYYTYKQNCASSNLIHDPENGITEYVIIEAFSNIHADEIAQNIGIYFDGVCFHGDDRTYGDRWEYQKQFEGTLVPEIYGKPANLSLSNVSIHYLEPREKLLPRSIILTKICEIVMQDGFGCYDDDYYTLRAIRRFIGIALQTLSDKDLSDLTDEDRLTISKFCKDEDITTP